MATAIPTDFERLGYKNGRIPTCALSTVDGAPNVILHPQAAEQLSKLITAANAAGFRFTIGSGYRTFDTQVQVKYKQGRGAASPGKSNHGWGTVIDVGELYQLAVTTADDLNRNLPTGQKVDRFSPAVHTRIRQTSGLYKWLDTNAPKYGWINPGWAKDGSGNIDECWHWEYTVFSENWPTRLPNYVKIIPSTQALTSRCGQDTSIRTQYARVPSGISPATSSMTPFLGSLESFHPRIQYELTRRRIAANTVNTYMPYVKLTSLTRILPDNLPDGSGKAWCPSLGPHGEDIISFDDIYLPKNNRSIIGYAIKDVDGGSSYAQIQQERVPVIVNASTEDQQNIPIPGITEVNAERGTSGPMGVRGGLLRANLKILAYSVGQLNALLRYFLRPATRVVLEFGRRSSDTSEPFRPYDWNQTENQIIDEFSSLINNPEAQTQFIEDYVYNNNGNYEIFVGYVAKFNVKYNKNNIYEIDLNIHSVQQFEIPTFHTGVKSTCGNATDKCRAMDIREYFDEAYAWKPNSFKALMSREEALSVNTEYEWRDDFISMRNPTTQDSGGGSPEAGLDESEYFVSWRFFVEKILNDSELGILGVVPTNQRSLDTTSETQVSTTDLLKLGLLRPVKALTDEELKSNSTVLIANQVGYHPDLRSTDPETMIIYNELAQSRRSTTDTANYTNLLNASLTTEDEKSLFYDNTHIETFIQKSGVKSFTGITSDAPDQSGTGLLSRGVWLNTKAIKQAFSSNDTVTNAINSLLSRMNAATEGYWNLQLYSADRTHSGLFVVDMGLSKRLNGGTSTNGESTDVLTADKEDLAETNPLNSISKVDIARYQKSPNKSNYIYMFNRGTKRLPDGELGTELLDLNVEFNLPNVIAVQAIANIGGSAQKGTLETIDIQELKNISLIKGIFAECGPTDICADEICDDGNLSTIQSKIQQLEAQLPTAGTSTTEQTEAIQTELNSLRQQVIQRSYGNSMVIDNVRQLSSLGTALNFVEFNTARMIKALNLDSVNADLRDATGAPAPRQVPDAHAFNSSNLTKTTVTLTLPGIGGIELFQSFYVDRIPSILLRGFYIVTKVIHKFSVSQGWTTTIEGRFRYRPIAETGNVPVAPALSKKDCDPVTGTPASTTTSAPTSDQLTLARTVFTRSSVPGPALSKSERTQLLLNDYRQRTLNSNNENLLFELEYLEKATNEPRFGTMKTREEWNRKVQNGTVNRQRKQLEITKAEIRRRIQTARSRGSILPAPLQGISDIRLRPTTSVDINGRF